MDLATASETLIVKTVGRKLLIDCVVSSIMTAKSGTLPDGKTRVKRYALKDKKCNEISQILINDVKACKGEALSPKICLAALTTSSRTDSKLEL